ncbi:hypothetical protein CTI12_AA580620 [Artemisia annua]|uniref:Hydroxyproline-rich glycoprotein family protein n=1 Tax=Artemisia annua TaxID=35608 RepID=A0A2U1KP21_ARTAN|nr:hypothetical protein CTI12_AA580620 [Artemisia annua]
MVIQQISIALLPLLLFSTITTVNSRPISTINRRGTFEFCNPFLETCSHQWPFTSTNNPFVSRPFLGTQTPQYVVVPSPPPVFTTPSFATPIGDTNPSFSPLVASPPPLGYTIPCSDDITNVAPPFFSFSFAPPSNLPGETILPPITERNDQPGFVMSPPDDVFSVPPPPVVDIDTEPPEDDGELPQQQPGGVVLPPPVDANAETKAKVTPIVQAPPAP